MALGFGRVPPFLGSAFFVAAMAYATLLEPFTKLVEVSIPGTLKNPHTKAVLQAGRPLLITAQAAKHKDCSHVVGDAVGGGFLAVAAAPKGRFAGVDTWSVVVVVSNSRGFVTLRGLKGWEFDRLAEESYNAVHTFTEAVAVRELSLIHILTLPTT